MAATFAEAGLDPEIGDPDLMLGRVNERVTKKTMTSKTAAPSHNHSRDFCFLSSMLSTNVSI